MKYIFSAILTFLLVHTAQADSIFVEAESFTSSTSAWQIANSQQTRAASRLQTLHGASGDAFGIASTKIVIEQPANYRVWVRYLHHESYRGAFRLTVVHGNKSTAKDFDLESRPEVKSWEYVWDYVDAELLAGSVELELSKFEQKNCSSYVRHIDCVLLTTDKSLVPDHLPYGPQTFLRVTLGEVYEQPVYVHIFADHYRSP